MLHSSYSPAHKALQTLLSDLEREHTVLQEKIHVLEEGCEQDFIEKRMMLAMRSDELERQIVMLRGKVDS